MLYENRFAESGSYVAEPCDCAEAFEPEGWRLTGFHLDAQDTTGEAWRSLVDLIDAAAADGREVFAPGRELPSKLWRQIVVLPPEVGKLDRVRKLDLYGSNLIAVPPQIGEMVSLKVFEPYVPP